MRLSKLPLSWKIAAPTITVFIFMLALSAISLSNLKSSMRSERLNSLKDITHAAQTIAKSFYALEQNGELTREEAQERTKVAIDAMRFDDGAGYVFVYQYDGINLVLPNKKLVGQNLIDMKDPSGQPLVKISSISPRAAAANILTIGLNQVTMNRLRSSAGRKLSPNGNGCWEPASISMT